MFYYNDPTFFLVIPALILAFYAQYKVQSTFNKYAQVPAKSGITGQQLGRALLDTAKLDNVRIESLQGNLTDNYDPREKKLKLSENVYNSNSVAALGVVAHEVGHAVQDANNYLPLGIRNNLVPAASLGTMLAFPLFFIGIIASLPILMDVGIIFFAIALAFQVITLPVELNASKRAIALLQGGNYLDDDELPMAKKVLSAAALTYIAAAAMAALNLLRLLILRNERD